MKNLKILLAGLFVFAVSQAGFGQSPSYSIEVKVPQEEGYTYSYSSKLCFPNTKMDREWFTGEISDIDWSTVSMDDYTCNELPNEIKGGFKYGNQIHAYECIANVRIIKTDGELADVMWIVFPLQKESFVTHVDLSDIEFRAGIYDLTDAFDYDTTDHLAMRIKDGYEWVKLNDSNLLGK